MKTVNDPTYDFVKGIFSQHIPLQSELSNPFNVNKRHKKRTSIVRKGMELPEDLNDWSSRNFSDYFALEYKKAFDGTYKITYTSDNRIINIILEFMIDNGLEKNEWAKKFIDWCYINKTLILQKSGHFLLPETINLLNRFYQDVINTNGSVSLLDFYPDVKILASDGKSKELFSKYGIPIGCTYYATYKKISDEQLLSGLENLFTQLSTGSVQEKKLLGDIVQKSISRSPYPENFKVLDWREIFSKRISKFKAEPWWRSEDYPGQPRFKVEKFLNG
jgi:hypothetical protein